ncbi:uncharacterized protein LOC118405549 [Branchiostoma floridae]|uniref:Uncharacterized protein LOC118405549 n=1 Tax=Branchiostoma floridae TaxID=7739 RepID=A0A9J7HK76_BRAFL|nr:uncharacterized protein LOC118405549 [Branchiostoma floridae]
MDRCTRAPGSCILEPSDEMFGGNPCDHIEGDVDTYLRVEHRCINVPLSLGCYQDEPVNKPLLTGPSVSHVNTTIQKCLKYCRAQSYRYAGVANRFGCRCGNQLQQDSASRRLPVNECTAPCGGDQFQFCGGPSTSQRVEVFEASIGACGGDLKANEGIIYSPDFPGPYPLDQNCVWNIQVAPEKVIRVKLELLDITAEDSLTIVEGNSSRSIVTFLNGTSEYVSFSSYVRLQFLAGPRRAQQTNGFILRYEGVGHCVPVTVSDDVISVSPNHGGNVAIGQRVTITCKNGQNVTVLCQKNGTFDIPTPYCSETTTDRGQDAVAWAAPVSVLGAVLLVSIGVFAIFIVKRRRAAKEPGTSTHDYDMVDPGTDDNDEYEMVDTRDSRPPARGPQAPAAFPPPPGAYGARSDSADYQALDPSTMGNTDSEYTSLTTNRAHPDYENSHEYLELSNQTTNRVRTDDSDYENDFEYEDTI